MIERSEILSFLIIIILMVNLALCKSDAGEAIKLKDISTLTFKASQNTNSRRGHHVPQLKCLGNLCQNQPDLVKCSNIGGKDNIKWRCKAINDNKHDERYSFDKLSIKCEGFDHPNDPYIVKGSCSLEYTLDRVNDEKMPKKKQELISQLISLVPKKSLQYFLKNIFTFIGFSAVVFLVVFGWPGQQSVRRTTPAWLSGDPDVGAFSTGFGPPERSENLWTTIVNKVIEIALEKFLTIAGRLTGAVLNGELGGDMGFHRRR